MRLTNLVGKPEVVHDDEPARLDDGAKHGPEVCERAEQPVGPEFREIDVSIRMVEPELVPIVVVPLLLQQHSCAGVVELTVVENDEAGIADEIRPHVVVTRRVSHLIDDEVVPPAAILPEKVVRGEKSDPWIRSNERRWLGRRRTHRSRGKPRWPAAARGCTEQCRI